MHRVVGLFLVLLLLPFLSPASEHLPRAAWIVRDQLATPAGARKALEASRTAGLDALLVQVRGRGDAYYGSELVPRAEGVAPDFDPLSEVLAGAGKARVLAWTNVFYLWEREKPPQSPSHVATARPEWLLRDADGRPVSDYSLVERTLSGLEGFYADPASTGYREHFCAVIRELASKYPIAGVHLDFVRYPGAGYGEGPLSRRFKEAWGLDPALIPEELRRPDLAGWLRGEPPVGDRVLSTAALLWAHARAAQVTAVVRAVRATLDSVRPGLELSAAVFPNPEAAFLNQGQDWVGWAEEGLVQALYPMTYSGGPERVAAQLRAVRDALTSRRAAVRLWAGLGGFIKDPEAIRAEASAARDLGYDGLCLFDLGSLLHKPGGLPPYADALRLTRRSLPPSQAQVAARPSSAEGGLADLEETVRKALGRELPEGVDLRAAVAARWREFEEARTGAIPRVAARLASASVKAPAWAEAHGMLRYAGGRDGEPAREAHRRAIEAARVRVASGTPLDAVARELSDGGSRGAAGVLGRRYLRPSSGVDRVLSSLEPGQVSPVVEAPGGFWLFRVERVGPSVTAPWSDAPWAARRQHFREELSRELSASPGAG